MSSPAAPRDPRAPNDPASGPIGPEPSIDTTKREAPGPRTQGPLTLEPEAMPTIPPGPAKNPIAQAPKLPHERDESVDMTNHKPDAQIEQAYRDVQRGLQDTGRGPPSEKAYQKQKS